jgi:ATP-dependent Lhr-like helicase
VARDLAEPSPLAHEILGAKPWAFLDDAPLEERRARAVVLRRSLPATEATGMGALDPEAIREVIDQARPGPRDADELHDLLLDVGFLPAAAGEAWRGFLDALVASGRAARARLGGREAWVAAERVHAWRVLRAEPGIDASPLDPPLAGLAGEDIPASPDEAAARALRGFLARAGPVTAPALAGRVGLPGPLVVAALHRLESEGVVLRGSFLPGGEPGEDWCDRGLLARIHRLTLGRLRREIEPVSGADLMRFLLCWQHASPGVRLHGARGLADVVGQLQGFHAAAGAWERQILPSRVAGYEPGLLDALCLSGEVAWGRLAVTADPEEKVRRRAAPTRHAPVTLALRADLPWLLSAAKGDPPPLGASARALVDLLGRCGACFLPDIAAMTGRLPGEAEGALWELVSAGLVTCDGFAGLRGLLDPPPRHRPRRPGQGGGRWALLRPPRPEGAAEPSHLEPVARQLLARWGVVFRDLLGREPLAPPWRELLPVYRALEARGEIRGGRFVAGLSGEQYALPAAVESLRAVRRTPGGGERAELSGADPLNLVGGILPGARVPATLGARVAYVDGIPVPVEAAPTVHGG